MILEQSAVLNKYPTLVTSVNNTSQTVSQQSTTSETLCLVSSSGQLQEQSFSVEVAERIAAAQRSDSGDFSTPSVNQFSDFFMYLYQDINRRPLTIDGNRKAIIDILGPACAIFLKV